MKIKTILVQDLRSGMQLVKWKGTSPEPGVTLGSRYYTSNIRDRDIMFHVKQGGLIVWRPCGTADIIA
jgi:hypothetical protein